MEYCKQQKGILEGRIQGALSRGEEVNAKIYATQLDQMEGQLATNSAQLANVEANYKRSKDQMEAWRREVVKTQQDAKNLGMELKMSEAAAASAEAMSSFDLTDPLNEVAQAREAVLEKIDANRAKANVSADWNSTAVQQMKDDQAGEDVRAEAILARFRQQTPAQTAQT